ncbi:SepM family pheromone-processing serine protease [Liquorilactobacillus mali]|uniref:SepM family pheromone-processing serine protease n=1 Tax=Liquorilactobacillus mali TaxID=1618 RepID=UPI002656936E|nr:SepM family pheromone-processing serine protease [Liquorilactobacillus mali]MDN7144506.1 SepM family pheromone-processing serine protease [Liquorilactobacillus mali]
MKKIKIYVLTSLGVIILAFICFFPLPIYLETVGKAVNVADYVRVSGKSDKTKGKLMLTYVSLGRATPVLYLASYLDKYTSRVSEDEISGNETNSEFDRIQSYYMSDAVNQAKAVSLRLAHKAYKQEYLGIYVMSVLKNSTFKNKLEVGDTITAVNNKSFKNTAGFMNYVRSQKKGASIEITYLRNGKQRRATGKTVKLAGTNRSGIGISLAERTRIVSSTKIKTNMDGIGGPSAGLMLALQMYSQLSKTNLKLGRNIAGTGTISSDGKVGDIGGIDKKVVAANRAGAKIFFAPNNPVSVAEKKADPQAMSNYQEAKKTVDKFDLSIKVVPVKTITDAISYLKESN